MSIKRTFTVYKLVRSVDGEVKEMAFSRQAQADQYNVILKHFGVTDIEVETEKRTVEL